MKRFHNLLILFLLISSVNLCFAQSRVYVKGHFRKNGTYVLPHYRTAPDGNFYNNWSTYGNINPYTGESGTKKYPTQNYSGYSYYKSSVHNFYLAPIPSKIVGTELNLPNNSFPIPNIKYRLPDIKTGNIEEISIPKNVQSAIKNKAFISWPNDYDMQAYTIRTQRDGYIKLNNGIKQFTSLGLPKDIINWSLNISISKWPNDYSMQAYTFENSLEGYLKLSALLSSDEWKSLPKSVSDAILQKADNNWKNDLSMQAYTVEQQLDGFYDLVELNTNLNQLPNNVKQNILRKARTSWPNDLSMQAYTIRNEISGYFKLQQLLKK